MRKVPKIVRKCKSDEQKRTCPCSTPLYLKVNAEEMHSPSKLTQVVIVENVNSTRIKRDFCKPTTKSDSNTTLEKGLVPFRDGNDTWRWWHFELETPAILRKSTIQMCKFPQNMHVRWRHWIRFMKSYLLSKFFDNRLSFYTKSTPRTEKVTHVFCWHCKLSWENN